jgi:hypothetical protein
VVRESFASVKLQADTGECEQGAAAGHRLTDALDIP